VNDGVKSRERSRSASTTPALTKVERRAAAKAARVAAARRRRWKRVGSFAGTFAAVVALILVVYLVFLRDKPETTPAAASCVGAVFPPVPADADPALCTKPGVAAGTGDLTELKVTTLIEGKGAATAAGQNLSVNYVGVSYRTGLEFDASWDRQKPISFVLGARKVIPGWDQGLAGVKVGSRVQLDVPSNLAYGDNPTGGEPAGPLRFVVDVLSAT